MSAHPHSTRGSDPSCGLPGLRLGAAAVVAALLAGLRAAVPEAEARGLAIYLAVASAGYGHLVGSALAARAAAPGHAGGRARRVLRATLWVLGLAVYLRALPTLPGLAFGLVALSLWHAVENDLALTPGAARPVAALPGRAVHHARALALTAVLGALFAATLPAAAAAESAQVLGLPGLGTRLLLPDLSAWLRYEEVFGAWTLYHVVSWLALSLRRARRHGRPLAPVLALQLAPPAACALLLWAPLPWSHPLRELVFAPAVYLYWSAAHVVQTLATRWRAGR